MRINKLKLGIAMAKRGTNFLALAEKSGVSRNTLSSINNGRTCSAIVLSKISKALEVKPEELIESEV